MISSFLVKLPNFGNQAIGFLEILKKSSNVLPRNLVVVSQ